MHVEKKRILKPDGRYLIYYHFPDTATSEESAVFSDIEPAQLDADQNIQPVTPVPSKEPRRV